MSMCKNLNVNLNAYQAVHWSSRSVFQWVSPSGCLLVERSVYLRKGVHTFEREQEPTPQLNTTMTAASVCCIWRSWPCLASMHISHVAQLVAVFQKDSKTVSYSVACKGPCVRSWDQEVLWGFLVSWKGSR